jgi:carbonic anhydrase/acetyltransferase-like protein (isoleucine patch superfamily)
MTLQAENTMPIYELDGIAPTWPEGEAWIAPDAVLIGKVRLEANASIWFGSVLRGDNELIHIGEGSNIQDACVLHTDPGYPLTVAQGCTVGHSVILHGCTVGENTLIGMGSTIMNGASIGRNCIIGANSLISEGKTIPDGSLVLGAPGRVIRKVADQEAEMLKRSAAVYQARWRQYASGLKILRD